MSGIWQWLVVQYRLARMPVEWKQALHSAQGMILHASKRPIEHGVELTFWVFPDDSKFGGGACMMPLDENGGHYGGLRPPSPTNSTSCSGETITWTWDARR